MSDLIDRQAAIDVLRTCYDTETVTYTNGNEYIDYDQALDLLNSLPTVQPEPSIPLSWIEKPVAHAHWFTLDSNQRTGKAYEFVCSNCERAIFTNRQKSINELGYVFCPHCGAKMDGEV